MKSNSCKKRTNNCYKWKYRDINVNYVYDICLHSTCSTVLQAKAETIGTMLVWTYVYTLETNDNI